MVISVNFKEGVLLTERYLCTFLLDPFIPNDLVTYEIYFGVIKEQEEDSG